eukprot:322798_1
MQTILRFNNMIHSLSTTEYESFAAQIFKDKSSLQSLLFNLFVLQLFSNAHTSNMIHAYFNVNEINHILRNIIQNRNHEIKSGTITKSSKPKKAKKINQVPSELINFVSSFLDTTDNINFSLSSRFLFIASRSPTKWHQITRKQMQKYDKYFSENNAQKLAAITMDRLKYSTNLSLNCTNSTVIYHLSRNIKIWNNLTTLDLYHCNVPDLLINLNHLNFQSSSIKNLTINDLNFQETIYFTEKMKEIAMVDEPEEFYALIIIIKQFPSLQFLSLNLTSSCIENYGFSTKQIAEIPAISNLRGLNIRYIHPDSIINFILLKCSSELRALHVGANDGMFGYVREAFPEDVKKWNFTNIEELCIEGDIHDEDALILNTINGNKLKRVCISIMNSHIYNLPKSVVSLLCYPSLEYIELSNSLDMSLKLLNKIVMVRRKSFKVQLYGGKKWNNQIHVQFVCMLNKLAQNTKDFMLILKYCELNINTYFSELKQKYLIHEYDKKLVISNFGCILNGYQEKWLMNCELCDSRLSRKMAND